ncbi:MAG: hypothetical protein IJ051_03965, partial [Clostridia bacterium]|nr:hypothetical protein [Clostridia bacterium]
KSKSGTCFFKKREKHVPWPLETLQPKQYQGRVLAKNRKNTSLGGKYTHHFLQAEGPQCPFGLLFAPCRKAEGLS